MTDDLTRLKALEAALRSTTQELWDRHSNAVLEAAGALAALSSARAEGWKAGIEAAANVAWDAAEELEEREQAARKEGMWADLIAIYKARQCRDLATAILALEEPQAPTK